MILEIPATMSTFTSMRGGWGYELSLLSSFILYDGLQNELALVNSCAITDLLGDIYFFFKVYLQFLRFGFTVHNNCVADIKFINGKRLLRNSLSLK